VLKVEAYMVQRDNSTISGHLNIEGEVVWMLMREESDT